MEFESLGARCSVPLCKQQGSYFVCMHLAPAVPIVGQLPTVRADFLPFTCDLCGKIFCGDHRSLTEHACPSSSRSTVTTSDNRTVARKYHCCFKACASTELVEYRCGLCNLQTCLRHRDPPEHACAKWVDSSSSTLKPLQPSSAAATATRSTAAVPTAAAQALGPSKPKTAAALAMDRKIRVMKLKGRVPAGEVGRIPELERLFLEVLHGAQAVTLCMHAQQHTLAHVLDRACKALRVENANGSGSADPGLRLSLWAVPEPPSLPGGHTQHAPDVGPLALDTPLAQVLIPCAPDSSSSSNSSGGGSAVLQDGACLRLVKGPWPPSISA